jgi:hypothetical protein
MPVPTGRAACSKSVSGAQATPPQKNHGSQDSLCKAALDLCLAGGA